MEVITEGLRLRQAVRGLIMSPTNSVLLVKIKTEESGEFWALPGGGKEGNETDDEALERELLEEVGLAKFETIARIWNQLRILPLINGKYDGQMNNIYWVRVDEEFDPKPSMTWEELNAENVFDIRWWSPAEIQSATNSVFKPEKLPTLIQDLIENGPPKDGPISIIG